MKLSCAFYRQLLLFVLLVAGFSPNHASKVSLEASNEHTVRFFVRVAPSARILTRIHPYASPLVSLIADDENIRWTLALTYPTRELALTLKMRNTTLVSAQSISRYGME